MKEVAVGELYFSSNRRESRTESSRVSSEITQLAISALSIREYPFLCLAFLSCNSWMLREFNNKQ